MLLVRADVVVALVHEHVHLFDQDAVGWDLITGLEHNNIANDEIGCENLLGGSILASEDGDFLVLDLTLESEELRFLSIVTDGLDEASEEDGKVDGDTFNPGVGGLGEQGEDQENGGNNEEELDVELVELVPKNGPK